MSGSESDIDMKSAFTKKKPKAPSSPSEFNKDNLKKITTKMKIQDALTELKSRKGVSLYAIKKYLMDKYQVDTERSNYIIKKSLKSGVEDGTFIQLKGVGASGSFKLAGVKEKVNPKKKKISKPETEKENEEKPAKKIKKEVQSVAEDKGKQVVKKKNKPKKKNEDNVNKKELEVKVTIKSKEKAAEKQKKSKTKEAQLVKTPAKKKTLIMRRKSSGSLIKPPKMKPKKM